MEKVKLLSILVIVFLITTVIFGSLSLYYFYQYENLKQSLKTKQIYVSLLIDFNNGTKIWYNKTTSPMTLFEYTYQVTNGKMEWKEYPYGKFITSILGVRQNENAGYYWMWYYYGFGKWNAGPVGADQYYLINGTIVKWSYEKIS